MKRRALLQAILFLPGLGPVLRRLLPAQPSPTLTDANIAALLALAEVVLPSAIGEKGRAGAVDRFARWIRNYREAADRGHSYGSSTLSQPSGPSPGLRYPAQFGALDALAQTRGAASFTALSAEQRHEVAQVALTEPTRVTSMPARPNGASLIADFMGYYFNSGEGVDLAYNAAIGRDNCRGLDGSDQAPAPLGRG